MNLTDRYTELQTELSSLDPTWVNFIKDHREELLARGEKKEYAPGELFKYEYRPASFIEANNLPLSSEWILLWMNNMNNRVDFVNISELQLPSVDHIQELHTQYQQIQSTNENPEIVEFDAAN